jgi:tRNA threonylcarbamoyladenosine biosynthesis protein TsaB
MSERKPVLVIDTAMDGCGVAVFDPVRDVLREAYSDEPQGQAQKIVPLVQDVVGQAELTFDDIGSIVVCHGPGTFTGIRIGLSAAKALGLVMDVPVYGISSLQALAITAAVHGEKSDLQVIVETRRQDFYVQAFTYDAQAIDEPASVYVGDVNIQGRVLVGNAIDRFDPDGAQNKSDVRKINVAEVARCFASGDKAFFVPDVEPIYLRAPDVSQPKVAPRILAKH